MTFTPRLRPKAREIPEIPVPSAQRVWLVVGPRGLLARRGQEKGERPALPSEDELQTLGIELDDAHYLGELNDAEVRAVGLPDRRDLPAPYAVLSVRELVQAFDEETFALAGRATHVLDWATSSRFCGRCGTKTERLESERCMKCPSCALTMYPRIAPAVIVLVRKGDQALLARNARFPIPFFSTLAGFSDVGENLEQTVEREILEEVGIRLQNLRYFGSQPWPFPHSLMIAFTADWRSGDVTVDGDEIAEARWCDVDALPLVPPRISIARQMIDAWVEEVTSRSSRAR